MILRDLSIIIADDHPILRMGLRNILERESFVSRLDEAANGQGVVELLKLRHYDLVFMDIRMKPMCGIQATKIIKNEFPNTKVLGFSMFNDTRFISEMKEAGAAGYMLKSSGKNEIINAITGIVSGRNFYTENCTSETDPKDVLSSIMEKEHGIKANHLREIIFLLCIGKISKEIAEILELSPRTVEKYRNDISNKLKIKNIAGIIRHGIEYGILEDEILKLKFEKYTSRLKMG